MTSVKEQFAKKKQQKQSKRFDINDLYSAGRCAKGHYDQGEKNLAIEKFTECINLLGKVRFPSDSDYKKISSEVYNNRAKCYQAQNEYQLAASDYKKAISYITSTNQSYIAEIYNALGLCYKELGDNQLALSNYDKAIGINSSCYSAYNNRGNYYVDQKQYDSAINDFKKAIALTPEKYEAYAGCATCYAEQGTYEIALEYLNKSIEYNPNAAIAYHNRAFCYLHLGKNDLALKDHNFSKSLEQPKQFQDESKEKELPKIEFTSKQYETLLEENKKLAEERDKANKSAHEKEKDMLSFFTHTMRNALATAPESLRQAIRLLGSEDYEKNQTHYEAINEITSLFSTIALTDCLIDTFKQSIYDTEEFVLAWQQDNTGDATPEWFIAAALRQSLNRIIFMEDATGLRKLINNQGELIKPTRKAFIEQVLPLDVNQRDVEKFYNWLQSMTALEVSVEKSSVQFGANQIKFSLMFAISSELILNALKYWSGTGKIQIDWRIEREHYIFSVSNACKANASSQLVGTHKGLAFINRLIKLLGEQAQFNYSANEQQFSAELKLHKTLLEG